MTVSGMMRRFSDEVKGRALVIKGRLSGKRRTEARGEAVQGRGDARASAHRLGRKLRGTAHR